MLLTDGKPLWCGFIASDRNWNTYRIEWILSSYKLNPMHALACKMLRVPNRSPVEETYLCIFPMFLFLLCEKDRDSFAQVCTHNMHAHTLQRNDYIK